MEWSIQEVARAAGTTSRTLRYYGEIGLLPPSRVGDNGYRFYDEHALVRLQRILLLRQLGVGIPEITRVLAGEQEPAAALTLHLELLEQEKRRIARLIATVESTLRRLEGGEQLMPEDVFSGFDHTRYREEVIERWGKGAYERSDSWWKSLSEEQKQQHERTQVEIAGDFAAALKDGKASDSDEVQAIARRHVEWLSKAVAPSKSYLLGLGEMHVADPRFAANYEKHAIGRAGGPAPAQAPLERLSAASARAGQAAGRVRDPLAGRRGAEPQPRALRLAPRRRLTREPRVREPRAAGV